MTTLNVDFNAIEENQVFEALPVGWYVAACVECEYTANRANTGHLIKQVWQVVEGQYKGRKLFANFNIENPNPEAVRIGLGDFKACATACGITEPNTNLFLNKICEIMVKIKKDDTTRNEIKGFKALDAQTAPNPTAQPAHSAPPPPVNNAQPQASAPSASPSNVPPFMRK